ncbi:hypothetical protein M9H77_02224 [Catharanthus roseus]|uniref:Uncharacterized protein n=1 Tax=Catharanthus roseus TaxID=4058 RepID=A0ACC0C832_CATRO|nr:hypothetical protein M9H77_02224 [Catharanthus roseus]
MRDDGKGDPCSFYELCLRRILDKVGIVITREIEGRNPTQPSKKIFKPKMFYDLFTKRFFNGHIKRGPIGELFSSGVRETLAKRMNIRSRFRWEKKKIMWFIASYNVEKKSEDNKKGFRRRRKSRSKIGESEEIPTKRERECCHCSSRLRKKKFVGTVEEDGEWLRELWR